MNSKILLIIRIIIALILVQTLRYKFTAHPDSVYIFSKIGLEPFGRIGIGILELIASILILIPKTIWAGSLLTIGTDGSGQWLATLQGSDTIQYQSTTVINATSTSDQTVIITYESLTGVIEINIDGTLAGTATLVTGTTATINTDETNVTIDGDFDINIEGLRFYDFKLNSQEITYLN